MGTAHIVTRQCADAPTVLHALVTAHALLKIDRLLPMEVVEIVKGCTALSVRSDAIAQSVLPSLQTNWSKLRQDGRHAALQGLVKLGMPETEVANAFQK